jgi:hypothetical protein
MTTLIKATLSIDAKDGGPSLAGFPWLYPAGGLEHEIANGLRHGDVTVQVHWMSSIRQL